MQTESSQKTILIIGINSFLGSNLAEFLKNDHNIVGTYFNYNFKMPNVLTLPCNVTIKEEVLRTVEFVRPHFIFYCAGYSSAQVAAQYPHMAEALNANGLYNIADAAQRVSARLFYFSSHHVLSGADKLFNEMDSSDPLTHLGKTQAHAEFYLQKSSLNYVVLRSGVLYGRGINPNRRAWFDTLESSLHKKENLLCDNDSKQGFLDIYYLCMIIKILIDRNVQNRLLHLSSQNVMSYYEFAKLYADIFGIKGASIEAGKWPRPLISSMNAEKNGEKPVYKLDSLNLETLLKIKMPTVRESLEFTKERMAGKSIAPQSRLRLIEERE